MTRETRRARCGPFELGGPLAVVLVAGLIGCNNGSMVTDTSEGGADGTDVAHDTTTDVHGDITDVVAPDVVDAADVPDAPSTTCTDTRAPTMVTMFAQCGTVCSAPTDAVLNAAGTTAYFTAYDASGVGSVFSVTSGGTPALVVGGFQVPIGLTISADSTMLYVLDLVNDTAGTGASTPPTLGGSTIYSVNIATMSKTSVALTGTTIVTATAIALSADGTHLLLTSSASDTTNGLYEVSTAGGAPTAVVTGMGFVDPAGIAVAPDGTIYVNDPLAATGLGGIISVTGSTATVRTPRFVERYPSGVALGCDNTSTLVSGWAPGGTNKLTYVAADGTTLTAITSTGIVSPNGLHRALGANVYVVADDSAGTGNSGAIFTVTP